VRRRTPQQKEAILVRTSKFVTQVGALAIAALVTLGVAGCAPEAGDGAGVNTAALPTGTLGAANFDEGYLSAGTGQKIIDVYIDPMCPYCAQFEEGNGEQLAQWVERGAITLRLHALTFLDPASRGTDYSTRASSALTCQATLNPDRLLDYLAALYANQPAENSKGLTNDELIALAGNGASIADCVDGVTYGDWSRANTEKALDGPIEGAEIPAITGTPTVLVNGSLYEGSITDTKTFAAFVSSH
jgi:protein-disulfide isomerase